MPSGSPQECEEKIIICNLKLQSVLSDLKGKRARKIAQNVEDAEEMTEAMENAINVISQMRLKYA